MYDVYQKLYGSHALRENYDLLAVPNLFSHTFGPLIYNHDFDIDGSGIATSSLLQTSSALTEVDISYYGGSGVLSPSGYTVGTYLASSPTDAYVTVPEFRNPHIVSAVDLVDCSSSVRFFAHPVFSVWRVARTEVGKYMFNEFLVDNTLIKYQRPNNPSQLPRIRLNIDNSQTGVQSNNFFEVDHEYEVRLQAHNLDIDDKTFGGLTLGMWIHTQPEDGAVWSYTPQNNSWNEISLSDLSSVKGVDIVKSNSQGFEFPVETIPKSPGAPSPDPGCGAFNIPISWPANQSLTSQIPMGSAPQTVVRWGDVTRKNISFKFNTFNKKVRGLTNFYEDKYTKVHRTDQKYTIEFFVMVGDDKRYIVFESISLHDLTNKGMAAIQSKYGNVNLDLEEFKNVIRYFKSIQVANASRNANTTAGVMETSGGSRLNYRSNSVIYYNHKQANFNNLTYVDITDG